MGQNVFKMCKLIEGNLKPFGFLKGEALSCLDHSWLSNKHVLVAGDSGKASISSRIFLRISVILQVYLFEDAELKTIFNMAELITELEPEPLIEQEKKDPNTGEEKRKIISQNVNLIFGPLFYRPCLE